MENEKNFENINDENTQDDLYISPETKAQVIVEELAKEKAEDKEIKNNGFLKELYEWTQAIAIAVVLALFINHFLFAIVEVNGSSMEPTLQNAERLFVRKFLYKPDNKDIVIVKSDSMGKYLVKRVIATEGQTIDINIGSGDVIVDGEVINEPYIAEKLNSRGTANEFPLTVPEDTVFVMGDNRNNSLDSRSIGVVEEDDVIGKASFRIWPIKSIGGLYKNLE